MGLIIFLCWHKVPCVERVFVNLPNAHLSPARLVCLELQSNRLTLPVLELFMLPVLETLDLSRNSLNSLNPLHFRSSLYPEGEG